jgi:hypothetical protein
MTSNSVVHSGIFAQRKKDRPNKIGVSVCELLQVVGLKLKVKALDAIDGTPILDIKPYVAPSGPRQAAAMDDRIDAGLFQLSSGHPPDLRFYLCRLPHSADIDELHFPRIGYRDHSTGAQSLDAGHCAVHDSSQFSSEISGSIFPQTTPCFRRGKPRRITIKLLWRDQAQHFA